MKFNKTKWLDLWKVVQDNKWARFIFCIGFNSIGKTYSVENGIAKMLKEGKRAVWIRNTEAEAIKAKQGWQDTLRRNEMLEEFVVKKDGIYRKDLELIKTHKGRIKELGNRVVEELVCPFVFMSSLDTSIPQIDNCRAFVYDEFIPGNTKRKFTIKEPLNDFRKMFFRLSRPATKDTWIPCIFISNPHNLESDFFSDFNIDLDWDKLYNKEDLIIEDKERGVLVLCFPTEWDIKENGLQKTFFERVNDGQAYIFLNNAYKDIIPKVQLEEELMYISLNGENYTIGKYTQDGKEMLRIQRKRDLENDNNIPWYCFLESDKIGGDLNIWVDEPNMLQITEIIHNAQLNEKRLTYDSSFTKKIWNDFLFERSLINQYFKK